MSDNHIANPFKNAPLIIIFMDPESSRPKKSKDFNANSHRNSLDVTSPWVHDKYENYSNFEHRGSNGSHNNYGGHINHNNHGGHGNYITQSTQSSYGNHGGHGSHSGFNNHGGNVGRYKQRRSFNELVLSINSRTLSLNNFEGMDRKMFAMRLSDFFDRLKQDEETYLLTKIKVLYELAKAKSKHFDDKEYEELLVRFSELIDKQ